MLEFICENKIIITTNNMKKKSTLVILSTRKLLHKLNQEQNIMIRKNLM